MSIFSIRNAIARVAEFIKNYPLSFLLSVLFVGIISLPVIGRVDVYFSSNQFCANTCHEMTSTVYKELKTSTHWNTSSGVRASCADCHVSERLLPAMWDHFLGTNDLIVHLTSDVSEPGSFDKNFRVETANRVRMRMLDNDSKNCRTCHNMAAINPKRKRGQKQHADALKNNTTCIACHYDLVHKEVEPSEEFLKALESR